MKYGYTIRPLMGSYFNSTSPAKSHIKIAGHFFNNSYFGANLHPYEIIFIKDKTQINDNRDINNLTINHNSNFDRLPSIPADFDWDSIQSPIVPSDFNWKIYLGLNPDVAKVHRTETGAIKHWLDHGFYEKRRYR